MSVATYSDLKTAIANWAHRTDLSAHLADFVTLAETRLYDLLLLKNMETETTLSTAVGSATVSLPSGYISPIALWLIVDSVRSPLEPATPEELPYYTENARPRYWAVDGDNIRFDSECDAVYSAPFRYIASSSLSDASSTNYLIRRRPDLYLAACMVEAARFSQDAEMFNAWESKFQDSLRALKNAENRARAMVPLRSDLPHGRRSNHILAGD